MGENVKVICRVRPLNSSEQSNGSKFIVSFPKDQPNSLNFTSTDDSKRNYFGKTFTFDNVCGPHYSQKEVYDMIGKPIINDVLNGYNGTVFAYGQTASGKTFTMEGIIGDAEYQGIMPRMISDIFNHIYSMDENLEFHIKVSYFEIYLDKIRDLLDVSKVNLPVHEDKFRVPYVKGITERFVSCPEEVFEVINEGKSNRHFSVTNMNEHSSRSHSVFLIHVRQKNVVSSKQLHGKLYMVDLAGSEKVAKTGAEGTVFDEAKNINKSLSALGIVINALVENSSHVPYRDSKLTRILQESLGGNARTTMVICVSPASYNETETRSTLMFGERAKTITNTIMVNEELSAEEVLQRYEKEKEKSRRLKVLVDGLDRELKRWRTGETVPENEWTSSVFNLRPGQSRSSDTPSKGKGVLESKGHHSTSHISSPTLSSTLMDSEDYVSGYDNESCMSDLYQSLNGKEEELSRKEETIDHLRGQIEELEDTLRSVRRELDTLQIENARLQTENDSSKDEVKEVLQALEELAVNYDQKAHESEARRTKLETTQEELTQQENLGLIKEAELQRYKDSTSTTKKRFCDVINAMFVEIKELGDMLNDQLMKPSFSEWDRIDEELTVLRLYTSKLKSEARLLQTRIKQANESSECQTTLVTRQEEEIKAAKIRLTEYEIKVSSLSAKLEEMESKKAVLEERLDVADAQLEQLRAQESGAASIEELGRQRDEFTAQIRQMRQQLTAKEKAMEQLQENMSRLTLEQSQLRTDLDQERSEHAEKKARLEVLLVQNQRRDQTSEDLRGLEDTVLKELNTLNHLRRLFVEDLSCKIQRCGDRKMSAKAGSGSLTEDGLVVGEEDVGSFVVCEEGDDESMMSCRAVQKQRILFLETNLEQLTKVHKQLVRDNADLRGDLPKLEKRLKAMMERVKSLENALRESKECQMRERQRYNAEVVRVREAVRQRGVLKRAPTAQIVKPIRAGHAPNTTYLPVAAVVSNSNSIVGQTAPIKAASTSTS